MPEEKFLQEYSGQSVDELIALAGEYRIDSLVLAFEQANIQKFKRDGENALSEPERIILAVEALEREVNNGGFSQFFENSSRYFAPWIVWALELIGCPRTGQLTQRAIDALHLPTLSVPAIESAIKQGGFEDLLNDLDSEYFNQPEDIEGHLFDYIKANKDSIRF